MNRRVDALRNLAERGATEGERRAAARAYEKHAGEQPPPPPKAEPPLPLSPGDLKAINTKRLIAVAEQLAELGYMVTSTAAEHNEPYDWRITDVHVAVTYVAGAGGDR